MHDHGSGACRTLLAGPRSTYLPPSSSSINPFLPTHFPLLPFPGSLAAEPHLTGVRGIIYLFIYLFISSALTFNVKIKT